MSDHPINSGGLTIYRATAECSACGKVIDIGPFENLSDAMAANLGGIDEWLLASSTDWMIRDGFGTPVTLCDECMGRPLRDVLQTIRDRTLSKAGNP